MPLVAAGRPVRFSMTLQDRDRNKGRCEVVFPATISIADLITNLASVEGVIAALSNAYIVDGVISIDLRQTTVAAQPPPESSDVERKGSFVFKTNVEGSFAKIEVPSIDPAIVIDGTNLINQDSAAVVAFKALMLDGVNGLVGSPVNGVGNDIVELLNARKIHRGSSKG